MKIKIKNLIIFSALTILTVSCTANFENINENPYEVNKTQMNYDAYSLSAAMVKMQGYVEPTDVNMSQFVSLLLGGNYGGYFADSNAGFTYKNFASYAPENGWSRVLFTDIIPNLFPSYVQVKNVTDDIRYLDIANIIKVAAVHKVTDAYGAIPYSKIGEEGSITATFDTQKQVYHEMIDELKTAVEELTPYRTGIINPKADAVFGGSIEKWIKFANTLELRLAMRLSYVEPEFAQATAEAIAIDPVGTMSTSSDNAYITVNKNPYRVVCYEYNGGDSRISADITTYMNGYNDPRRAKYFTESTFTQEGVNNGYYGLRSGIEIPSGDIAHAYSNFNVSADNRTMLWMDVSEAYFLKAEGALRGWNMGGTAEDFYNEGIRLSFEQWGADGAEDYINNDTDIPAPYVDPLGVFTYGGAISNITIKYDSSAPFETNLERIITQKWIANFPLGLESWSEFRRTGYPILMNVELNRSGGIVSNDLKARRLPYPQEEYQTNEENIKTILPLMKGPDNMATNVWWDTKNT